MFGGAWIYIHLDTTEFFSYFSTVSFFHSFHLLPLFPPHSLHIPHRLLLLRLTLFFLSLFLVFHISFLFSNLSNLSTTSCRYSTIQDFLFPYENTLQWRKHQTDSNFVGKIPFHLTRPSSFKTSSENLLQSSVISGLAILTRRNMLSQKRMLHYVWFLCSNAHLSRPHEITVYVNRTDVYFDKNLSTRTRKRILLFSSVTHLGIPIQPF